MKYKRVKITQLTYTKNDKSIDALATMLIAMVDAELENNSPMFNACLRGLAVSFNCHAEFEKFRL